MAMVPRQIIDISFASIIKVAVVVFVVAVMYFVKDTLALVFLAIIIASTVDRWANFFEHYRIPRMGGVALVYAGFIAFLVVVLYFVVPPILEEVKQLIVFLPDYYDVAAKQIFRTTRGISPDYARSMQEFVTGLEARITGFTSGALSAAVDVFGGVVSFGVVIVISFYLAMQRRGVEDFLRLVTPQAQEEYILDVWRRVEIKLGKWLEGQLLLGCIVGVSVFVGLSLIGVPYALLLGLVAGIFEIIPIAGPLFSALIGIFVAFLVSPVLALLALFFYGVLQQIENHVLVPLFMKKITGLNPVVVIVALLVGAKLGGILGMLIAVPLATVGGELMDDLAKKKAGSA